MLAYHAYFQIVMRQIWTAYCSRVKRTRLKGIIIIGRNMIQSGEEKGPRKKRLGERLQLVESPCEKLQQDGEKEILSVLGRYLESLKNGGS